MAYVERLKSGKKEFYYLVKTIRIGPSRWKKIRVKLGTEKPSKADIAKSLKSLRLEDYKVYNEEYLDASKLEFIDDFMKAYRDHLKKIPKSIAESEESDFTIRFTYNSNAIEGNRLTLRDTYMVIKEKQIPSGAPPKDYNEAINGRDAMAYLEKYEGKLTLEFMEKLNEILVKNTGVTYPGRIRFFPINIEGTDFVPPDEKEVPKMLKATVRFYYDKRRKIHPFVLACLLHAQFVEVHPFEDGNGRTGRALMNWVLIRAGYPKMFIPVKLRQQYYEAIDKHNDKDFKGYCTMMFDIMASQMSIVHKKKDNS